MIPMTLNSKEHSFERQFIKNSVVAVATRALARPVLSDGAVDAVHLIHVIVATQKLTGLE